MIRLFRVSIPTSVVLLILYETILLTACYLAAGMVALEDPIFYLTEENGWLQIVLVIAGIMGGFYLLDLYDDLMLRSRTYLLQQLCLVLGVSFIIQAILGYSSSSLLQLPQWTMMFGSALVLLVIPGSRALFMSHIRGALPVQRVLFVGGSLTVDEIIQGLVTSPDSGFTGVGYLAQDSFTGDVPFPRLGGLNALQATIEREHPDKVIVSPENLPDRLVMQLLDFRTRGVNIELATDLFETLFGRVPVRDLQAAQVLSSTLNRSPWTGRIQAVYSFLIGVVGLIVTAPILLVVAVLVKITSKGPALYSQKRVGLYGKTFSLYKFRSMYTDAEARTGPVWATKNDPRVTPLGRWLRKLRLDELPQFFNLLRGDMAIVGPRPERPEFCQVLQEKFPFYQQRHTVKPGITGWAQINHKYTETVEDTLTKLEYDLYYVKHLAPALDAYVIFHTFKVMLLFRGAQ